MRDLVLPAFAMDCRDWLVITPSQAGLPEEVGGAPLLAVLSTAVVGTDDLRSASGVLTVGLLDADIPTKPVPGSAVALELVEDDWSRAEDSHRYLLPAPEGQLALVAEFSTPDGTDAEVVERIEALMASFHWAA
ncbi:MAG TPA: hypothetical protein VGH01_06915 [Jatrophihabitantaceae bacterium]|jgi:hypothetical protein